MDMDYLRYCIRRAKATQRALACQLEISDVAIYRKMNGKIAWSLDDIRNTKQFLCLSDDEVLRIWNL